MKSRKINKLVVHVSDSPDDLDIGVKEIRAWHTEPPPRGNGWADIGYHFIIRRSGKVERGRDEQLVGAHVKGHNSDSLGIVWVGRKVISEKQYTSLLDLLVDQMSKHKLDIDRVVGHKELDSRKTCPNLDIDKLRADLLFHKQKKSLLELIRG